MNALVDIHASLQRLQPYLVRNEQESKWVDQLKGYLDRLRSSSQPQSPEEQFNQLYALRKWLFWVPISLLAAKRGDVNVLVVLAHFYATALALEPMFPDVASVFVADLSLRPLEEINNLVQGFQDPRYDSRLQTMSYLVQFPIDMVSSYKTRREWSRQQMSSISPMQQQSAYALESINLDLENHIAQYSYGQSLSPAFAPSPLRVSAGVACSTATALFGPTRTCIRIWNAIWLSQRVRGYTYLDVNERALNDPPGTK